MLKGCVVALALDWQSGVMLGTLSTGSDGGMHTGLQRPRDVVCVWLCRRRQRNCCLLAPWMMHVSTAVEVMQVTCSMLAEGAATDSSLKPSTLAKLQAFIATDLLCHVGCRH
jgi:hypothetical protein